MRKKGGNKKIAKKTKIARKKFLYKFLTTIAMVVILILLAGSLVFIVDKYFIEKGGGEGLWGDLSSLGAFGTHDETGVYFPEDCSDVELMRTWNSVFESAPSEVVIRREVISGGNPDNCESYLMQSIPDVSPYDLAWVIYGGELSEGNMVAGFYTKLTSQGISFLEDITDDSVDSLLTTNFLENLVYGEGVVEDSRDLQDIDSAESEFDLIFVPASGTWEEIEDELGKRYVFGDLGLGIVYASKSLDIFMDQMSQPINLTFTQNITDGNNDAPVHQLNPLYESKHHTDQIDLRDYFVSLGASGEVNFRAIVRPPGGLVVTQEWADPYIIGFDASRTGGGEFEVYFILNHSAWLSDTSIPTNNFSVFVYGCYDNDADNSGDVEGTTYNASESERDSCSNEEIEILTEYSCDVDEGSGFKVDIKNETINCSLTGEICRSGVCKEENYINHPPEFLDVCGNLSFYNNTDNIIDLNTCFSDPEGRDLNFSYEYNGSGVSLNLTGANLNLVPNIDWIGNESINLNASDGENVTSGVMDFSVIETGPGEGPGLNQACCLLDVSCLEINEGECLAQGGVAQGVGTSCVTTICSGHGDPVITSYLPEGITVNLTKGEAKTFTIIAENADEINWYLDEEFTGITSSSYTFNESEDGYYNLRVEVWGDNKMVPKSWDVYVNEKEKPKRSYLIYFIIGGIVVGLGVLGFILYLVKSYLDNQEPRQMPKDSSIPLITASPRMGEGFKLPETKPESRPLFIKPQTFPKPKNPFEEPKKTDLNQ